MIPVTPAAEPGEFDAKVRQKGQDAIAELIGQKPSPPRPGPRRQKVAERPELIAADKFPPFWRDVLPEMLNSYRRICAYLSLYIPHGTGSPTVDHVLPKSRRWDLVYEWSNYRLACALMNSCKNDLEDVLDPFEIKNGWFALDLVEFQVKPGREVTDEQRSAITNTIIKLRLNANECLNARKEYVDWYLGPRAVKKTKPDGTTEWTGLRDDPLPFSYLEHRAPFVARELRKQNMLRPEDV